MLATRAAHIDTATRPNTRRKNNVEDAGEVNRSVQQVTVTTRAGSDSLEVVCEFQSQRQPAEWSGRTSINLFDQLIQSTPMNTGKFQPSTIKFQLDEQRKDFDAPSRGSITIHALDSTSQRTHDYHALTCKNVLSVKSYKALILKSCYVKMH